MTPKVARLSLMMFDELQPLHGLKERYRELLEYAAMLHNVGEFISISAHHKHSQYIIMTFIHGPVCKGQIALNVIDDHFWVLFMDPSHDLTVSYPGFLRLHSDKLRMPIEQTLVTHDSSLHRRIALPCPKRTPRT